MSTGIRHSVQVGRTSSKGYEGKSKIEGEVGNLAVFARITSTVLVLVVEFVRALHHGQ